MSEKIKYEMEFVIQSSPQLLFQYLATPSGLPGIGIRHLPAARQHQRIGQRILGHLGLVVVDGAALSGGDCVEKHQDQRRKQQAGD